MSQELTNARIRPSPKRSWFRFSLRTFLIVITAVCLWLGWKVNAAREQRLAVASVRELGGSVVYDYEVGPGRSSLPPEPAWFRKLFGVDFLHDVVELNAAEVEPGSGLGGGSGGAPARGVSKDYRTLMPQLRHFPRLRILRLRNGAIGDDGLQHVAALKELEQFWLGDSDITDAGIEHLANLPSLKCIYLQYTHVTDRCVDSLSKIAPLVNLYVYYTHITADGMHRLQQLRPDLIIHFDPNQSLPLPVAQ